MRKNVNTIKINKIKHYKGKKIKDQVDVQLEVYSNLNSMSNSSRPSRKGSATGPHAPTLRGPIRSVCWVQISGLYSSSFCRQEHV